jgi:hypothetical protein
VTLDENTERVSGNNVKLKWRTNENAIFQCAVDSLFNNRDCGSGTASEVILTDLEDGPHTVWIKAVDELGNRAPWKKHTWTVGEWFLHNTLFRFSTWPHFDHSFFGFLGLKLNRILEPERGQECSLIFHG